MDNLKAAYQYVISRWGYKKPIIVALLVLWGFKAFLRQNGLLGKTSLRNKVVFITGGGSGIGRQLAFRMSRLGAKICVVDLNREAAEQVAQNIVKEGKQALAIHCDVTDKESVRQAAEEARKTFTKVDIIINNAGIVSGAKLVDLELQKVELTFNVNSISHFYTTKEFLPSMLAANSGHVVTIASMAGKVGNPMMTDYCASKWAAIGFTESLRVELKTMKSRVKTTCINPFYINTGMFKGVSINPLTMFTGMLDEGYVANRIIWAIQQGEEEVCMPWV
jgi:all-trans-retinol dehydrogenase (NAD+)